MLDLTKALDSRLYVVGASLKRDVADSYDAW